MSISDTDLIIYGYALPSVVVLAWIVWNYSRIKTGKRYVSHFVRDWWPIIIPGVSAIVLSILLTLESFILLERIGRKLTKEIEGYNKMEK